MMETLNQEMIREKLLARSLSFRSWNKTCTEVLGEEKTPENKKKQVLPGSKYVNTEPWKPAWTGNILLWKLSKKEAEKSFQGRPTT